MSLHLTPLNRNYLAVALALVALIPVAFASSQGLLPCVTDCTIVDLIEIVISIYNFLLSLAGFVAIIFITWGALRMFYWGFMEDSPSELEGAKNTVRRAIGGLVIIMIAYVIVNTVIIALSGGALGVDTILGDLFK